MGSAKYPSLARKRTSSSQKFNISPPYFLAVGTLKPNKNYPFLIKAFSQFLKLYSSKDLNFSLVIAGKKGWLYDEIFKLVKEKSLLNNIIFTDFINETEKWALY